MRGSKTNPPSAWETAQAAGFDMSLIEINLKKTPRERIRSHSRALRTALALRRGMEKRHART